LHIEREGLSDGFVKIIAQIISYHNLSLLPHPEKRVKTEVGGSFSEAGKKANTSRVKVARGVLPLTVTRLITP